MNAYEIKMSLILTGFLILLVFRVQSYEINGNFKECIVGSNLNMLKFDQECFRDPNEYVQSFFDDFISFNQQFPIFVFSKRNSILETKGYECQLIIHRYRYSKDFLFNKYFQNEIEIVHLKRIECLLMIKEKQCGRFNKMNKMSCNSKDECFFVEKITDEYPFYFGSIEKEFVECKFTEKIVMAQSLTESIFHNSLEPCFAEDEVCYFLESTVVWERDDVRKCPFERLIEIKEMRVKQDSKMTIFVSTSEQYLFKLTKKEKQCGYNFYETSEGLYLVFYDNNKDMRNRLLEMPISKYNINHFVDKDRNDLILAENDYAKFKITEMMLDIACSMFLNTIQMSLDQNDKFLSVNYLGKIEFLFFFFILNLNSKNKGRQNLIIYINSGQAFLPLCTNVSIINVVRNIDKNSCEKNFEITYSKNNQTKIEYGYLRENNIITQYSTRLDDCETNTKSLIIVPNEISKALVLKRNKANLTITELDTQITKFELSSGSISNLYNHHDYLVNGSDFYEKIGEFFDPSETVSFDMGGAKNYIEHEKILINKDPLSGFKTGIDGYFGINIIYIKIFLIFTCLALILIVLSFILFKYLILPKIVRRKFHKIDSQPNFDRELNFV